MVLHARIAAEHLAEPVDVDDVARVLVAKLRRRHPHVFEADRLVGRRSFDVEAAWEGLKAAERDARSSFDGVPVALPALQRAQEVLDRAERLDRAVGPASTALPVGAGLGEHLLAVVQTARAAGQDAEAELRAAVRRLERDARAEEAATRAGP